MRPRIRRKIPDRRWWVATVLWTVACGGTPSQLPSDPTATPKSPPLPLAQVYILESWGAPAEDTVVRFRADQPRIILLRRGSPDNGEFARLSFPAGTVVPRSGDSSSLTIRARSGLYGIDIETEDEIRPGAFVTFSYGIHFVAPAGARTAYGSDYRFERFLAVSQMAPDSTVVFLDSWRTASDLLTALLPGAGQYLVAAPRAAPSFRTVIW